MLKRVSVFQAKVSEECCTYFGSVLQPDKQDHDCGGKHTSSSEYYDKMSGWGDVINGGNSEYVINGTKSKCQECTLNSEGNGCTSFTETPGECNLPVLQTGNAGTAFLEKNEKTVAAERRMRRTTVATKMGGYHSSGGGS